MIPDAVRNEVRNNGLSPTWWLTNALPWGMTRGYYRLMKWRGADFMAEDWDNMIILDACRYDMFEELHPFSAPLSAKLSKGSCTPDFVRENFLNREFHDTVYVTANPTYLKGEFRDGVGHSAFHDVIDVWEQDWNEELNTVMPESMVQPAIEAHDRYPNKRVLVHFMQPHRPFVGEFGRQIDQQKGSTSRAELKEGADVTDQEGERAWKLLELGELSIEDAWKAYRENLEIAFPHVEELLEHLEGKTVVTSDHGNLVDEPAKPFPKRMCGHPGRTWTEHLVKVPWLTVEGDRRKEIRSEPPRETGAESDLEKTEERLRDLGYVDP